MGSGQVGSHTHGALRFRIILEPLLEKGDGALDERGLAGPATDDIDPYPSGRVQPAQGGFSLGTLPRAPEVAPQMRPSHQRNALRIDVQELTHALNGSGTDRAEGFSGSFPYGDDDFDSIWLEPE